MMGTFQHARHSQAGSDKSLGRCDVFPTADGGVVHSSLTRFKRDGSVDFSYKPPLDVQASVVEVMADGRAWIVEGYPDWTPRRLIRLQPNGPVEQEFLPLAGYHPARQLSGLTQESRVSG